MTVVTISQQGITYEIEAKGHASGKDPAPCAGITAILGALAGYLENAGLSEKEYVKLEPGDAHIIFSGGDTANAVFEMAVVGLLQIEMQYPGYIKVEQKPALGNASLKKS